jgi:hypothetical protein
MSTSAARLLTDRDVVRVTRGELPPNDDDVDREAVELANASIVAAALGLGIYIETLV